MSIVPVGTVLGNLTIDEVFDTYDGPRLFTCTNGDGQSFIGLWIDDLRLGVKEGLKTAARVEAESAGLEAFGAEISPRALSQSGRRAPGPR